MKISRSSSAFTLIELLVVITIIGILATLMLPNATKMIKKGQMTQTLNNMRQLHGATMAMALDGTTTGDAKLGWPGDTGGTWAAWATGLTDGSYLKPADFRKLISAAGVIIDKNATPDAPGRSALTLYQVTENSDGNTVFLSTANFAMSAQGGTAPTKEAVPYGDAGFIVYRKAGDGQILQVNQSGTDYADTIGSYVAKVTDNPPAK